MHVTLVSGLYDLRNIEAGFWYLKLTIIFISNCLNIAEHYDLTTSVRIVCSLIICLMRNLFEYNILACMPKDCPVYVIIYTFAFCLVGRSEMR